MRSFPELSYANRNQPFAKRWFIRSVERLSGRDRYARLYDIWRTSIVPDGEAIFTRMLDLIDVRLDIVRPHLLAQVPAGPLVIVANHPFGIGDGIAALSLAERLGRPFRVMINAELLKIREMEPYSLSIDFSETKEALRSNMAMRHEALKLLREGVTIVVFPGGGVATARSAFGLAEDLPWKMFPARLIQEAKATVLPVHFAGQNGRLFHLVSRPMLAAEEGASVNPRLYNLSLTLRTSLLLREFARLSGRSIEARIGEPIVWDELAAIGDRRALTRFLQERVVRMGDPVEARPRLPRRLRAQAA